jgi:hypothetical protein
MKVRVQRGGQGIVEDVDDYSRLTRRLNQIMKEDDPEEASRAPKEWKEGNAKGHDSSRGALHSLE